MKKLITIIAAVSLCAICMAAPPQTRHNVRLGWGDMLFETLVFHPTASPLNGGNGRFDNSYTGHIFADYMYSLTSVVSVGMQADFEGIFWKEGAAEGVKKVNNYNLSMLPSVRFTFFRSEWVNLYSGVSLGLLMAFDNQNHFEAAPAFNLNLFGVKVGKGHWGGFFELGALNALTGGNSIYMLGSRLMSVGVNYTW